MICPQHDTHIDTCAHMRHVSANWEIRIPVHTDSRTVTRMAQDIGKLLSELYGRTPAINIGEQTDTKRAAKEHRP